MRDYKPRRCGKRWLDGDCPDGVLAIFDHPNEPADRYTVFYSEPYAHDDPRGPWLSFIALDEYGANYHGEMKAHEVADYRYRQKHRYAKWSSLPDAVKRAVRADLGIGGIATGVRAE